MSSTSLNAKPETTISCLPAEIRSEIIHHAMDDDRRSLFTVMHVCRSFRILVFADPTIWRRALRLLDNYHFINLFLCAGNYFVRAFHLDEVLGDGPTSMQTRIRIAGEIYYYLPGLAHATRIISCRTIPPFIDWSPVLAHIGHFDNLTCLKVCVELPGLLQDTVLPEFSAPHLTDLTLACVAPTMVLAPAAKRLLSRFPSLCRLSLKSLGVHAPGTSDERISLPSLKHLEVQGLSDLQLRSIRNVIDNGNRPLSLVLRMTRVFNVSLREVWPDVLIRNVARFRVTVKPSAFGIQVILEDADARAMRSEQLDWAKDCALALTPSFIMKEYRHDSLTATYPYNFERATPEDIYPHMLDEATLYADRVDTVVVNEMELGQTWPILTDWVARSENMVRLLQLFKRARRFKIQSAQSLQTFVTCVPLFLWPTLRDIRVTCLPVDGASTAYDQAMIDEVAKWLDTPSRLGAVAVFLNGDTDTERRALGTPVESLVLNLDVLITTCSVLQDGRSTAQVW